MKLTNKLFVLALCSMSITGCQQGLVYDEVPESVYNDVSLKSNMGKISGRELFQNKIWQEGFNQWAPNMILTTDIGSGYENGKNYTNKTGADVTILGKVVKAGETISVKHTMTTVDDATAPDGKLYILNLFADPTVKYTTPNKKHLFLESAFVNDAVKPVLIDPVDGKSQSITLPARQNEIIVALSLNNTNACSVESVAGAPQLGVPGDFTHSHRYMVTNITKRSDGGSAKRALYEVRLQILK